MSRDHGPSYPEAWDPRVEDLVDFVADQRDLSWEHPVYIDFVDEESFEGSVKTNDDELSDEDRRELDDATATLRAMGLVEGEVDLLSEQNDLRSGGVAAYYHPETKRISVRGTELTVAAKVTLVHELTHALQDQNFDLTRIGDLDTDAENQNLRMVVEGDASEIEGDYVEQLSESDRNAYIEESKSQGDEAKEKISEVPDVMVALFSAPYRMGPPFVAAIRERGGNAAVDALIRTPPKTEAQILDLRQYLDGRDPIEVAEPPLDEGTERIDDDEFGALGWYLVLAERIDPREALDVVDGWAGDSMVTYREGDRVCVAARYRGVDAEADQLAEGALLKWTDTMPAGMAHVTRSEDFVQFVSCDPGADSALDLEGRSTSALEYPTVRLQIEAQIFKEFHDMGQPVDDALTTCAADSFVRSLTLDEITNEASLDPSDIQDRMKGAVVACRR